MVYMNMYVPLSKTHCSQELLEYCVIKPAYHHRTVFDINYIYRYETVAELALAITFPAIDLPM